MSDVTLSYKGSDILELSDSGSATLKTGGTYCEADIEVEYVKPSGGSGELPSPIYKFATGIITLAEDATSIRIDHNLGSYPDVLKIYALFNETNLCKKNGGMTVVWTHICESGYWKSAVRQRKYIHPTSFNILSDTANVAVADMTANYLTAYSVTNYPFKATYIDAGSNEQPLSYRWVACLLEGTR